MASRIASASFLLATLFFSGAIAATDFDFFYYVIMWPGAFCRQERRGCCLPTSGEPELDFFVKGLYTYNSAGDEVTKCNKTNFYVNEVKDLISDLYAYWPSIKCPSNNGLKGWTNAWKTYGICSGMTEKDYFTKALQLHSKLDMLSKLRRADIVPTDEIDYRSAYVQAAINNIVGNKAAVRCGQTRGRKYQLSEIWVCVAKDATTLIPCPVFPSFTCGSRMNFSPFTYDMMKDSETSESFNPIEMPTSLTQ